MNSTAIISYARTPIGKYLGSLSSISAPKLCSEAIKETLNRASLPQELVPEAAFIGNVLSAGIGQAPARQAILGAKLPSSTICTTVNKVCASGMKSVIFGTQSIQLNEYEIVLAGGMESMSNVPHYLPKSRTGIRLGHGKIIDGVIHDGLWDVYNNQHMGHCAEKCAVDYNISRHDQDGYATMSYIRARRAYNAGILSKEIVPIQFKTKKSSSTAAIIDKDEELDSIDVEKIVMVKPAFQNDEDGTVTAANASSLNDGAAAMLLMNEELAMSLDLKPIARILSYADAEQDPVEFTTTPSLAITKALQKAGLTLNDVDYFEINEAFSVVALANAQILDIDIDKCNVFGGAVALGHPIGMSGTRIIGTLCNVLQENDGNIGVASVCNGGGGASAVVIERIN